jgi:hypothetical protein
MYLISAVNSRTSGKIPFFNNIIVIIIIIIIIVSGHFMEPEGSIPDSQELSTCPYP